MYMGLENEFTVFSKKNNQIDMDTTTQFSKIITKKDYQRSPTAIRTPTGNAIYADGKELEVLTAPISVNKGFSTRLVQHLVLGRNRIIKALPKYKITGYSMHWNVSSKNVKWPDEYYTSLNPIFQLFTETPLSKGMNMRDKTAEGRYELLGDSINSYEQLQATALLLGAFTLAYEKEKHPLQLRDTEAVHIRAKPITGRDQQVPVMFSRSVVKHMPIQQYLELTYKWVENYIHTIGTRQEIQSLEDFISGKKELEMDKKDLYEEFKAQGLFRFASYYPPEKEGDIDFTLSVDPREKLIPEGKLLGSYTTFTNIKKFHWDLIEYEFMHGKMKVEGVEDIYRHLNMIKKVPGFKYPVKLRKRTRKITFEELLAAVGVPNH